MSLAFELHGIAPHHRCDRCDGEGEGRSCPACFGTGDPHCTGCVTAHHAEVGRKMGRESICVFGCGSHDSYRAVWEIRLHDRRVRVCFRSECTGEAIHTLLRRPDRSAA